MVSCLGTSQSTPYMQMGHIAFRTSAIGVQDTVNVTDSLNVGDTLRLSIAVSGGFNSLKSFEAQSDTSAMLVSLQVDSAVLPYLIDGTDLAKAKMVFAPEQVASCTAWLHYVTRKSGTHRIEMTVANDASSSYSPRVFYFDAIVR